MKQPDCMFIQKNTSGDIYHLCYTDNTRETISRSRFAELARLATYDPEDGVYWFYSNKSGLAETPQEMTMTPYNIGDTVIGSDGYYRVAADGVKGMRLQFDRPFIPGEIVRGEFGDVVQTPQDAPKTHGGKKVVLVHRIDGRQETDADWLARQAELEDYAATVDAASYRQGV